VSNADPSSVLRRVVVTILPLRAMISFHLCVEGQFRWVSTPSRWRHRQNSFCRRSLFSRLGGQSGRAL